MTGHVTFRVTVLLTALALSGCGDEVSTDPAGPSAWDESQGLVEDDYSGRFRVTTTVLESPGQGPELCAGGVAESLPPQCGGPEIAGWDWDAVDAESASGTTWGEYTLTGTWDGARFTLTEPAEPPVPLGRSDAWETDFSTPCPEPDGGWRPVDPATATDEDLQAAMELARESPDYAGSWVDQSYLDTLAPDASDAEREAAANDPARLVLNLRFTRDLEAREQEVRAVWGGALCVSAAERTEAELRAIQEEMSDLPGFLGSGVTEGAVQVSVLVAHVATQRELDDRYGAGVVRLVGALRPID
jgi:hypothetical protein